MPSQLSALLSTSWRRNAARRCRLFSSLTHRLTHLSICRRLLNADRARTSLDESSTLSEVEELLAQFRAQQQIAAELADMRPPSPPPLPPSLSKCKLDEMDNSAAEVSPAGVKVAETPLEVSRLLDRLVKRPSSPPKSAASGPLKKLTTGFSSFTDRLAKPFKGLSSSL